MVPAVYQSPKARHEAQGSPAEGRVFPAGSASGHLDQSSAKIQHDRALRQIRKEHEIMPSIPAVKTFEPYCMRHAALTWLEESGCDAFTVARIAGHSSITMTQR
jgi:integrase